MHRIFSIFLSLWGRGGGNPPPMPAKLFSICIWPLVDYFSKRLLDSLGKIPYCCFTSFSPGMCSCSWNLLAQEGSVSARNCSTRSWYNQHPPPRGLGCLGQNLQREKTFRRWDCEGAWAWVLDKGKRMDFGAFQREGKPKPESDSDSSGSATSPAIN